MSPFVSKAQQRYMYSHPTVLGRKALTEWSDSTNFKALPEKKSPKKSGKK
jgi:hypothetical protein